MSTDTREALEIAAADIANRPVSLDERMARLRTAADNLPAGWAIARIAVELPALLDRLAAPPEPADRWPFGIMSARDEADAERVAASLADKYDYIVIGRTHEDDAGWMVLYGYERPSVAAPPRESGEVELVKWLIQDAAEWDNHLCETAADRDDNLPTSRECIAATADLLREAAAALSERKEG